MREIGQEPPNPSEPKITAQELDDAYAMKPVMDELVERKRERQDAGDPMSKEVIKEIEHIATRVGDKAALASVGLVKQVQNRELQTSAKAELAKGNRREELLAQLKLLPVVEKAIEKVNNRRDGVWYKIKHRKDERVPEVDIELTRELIERVGAIFLSDLEKMREASPENRWIGNYWRDVGKEINKGLFEEAECYSENARPSYPNDAYHVYRPYKWNMIAEDKNPDNIAKKIGTCIFRIAQGEAEYLYNLLFFTSL